MRKNVKIALEIIVFLAGVSILIYPMITNYLYDKNRENLERHFDNITTENTDKRLITLYDLLNQENKKIYETHQESFIKQTVSYENSIINLSEYGLEDNIIGFLKIPSIQVNLPIYLGANPENMNHGAVHLTGTSFPIGGKNTNSVLAAHRGYYAAKMFRNIDNINIGDILYVKNFIETLSYKAIKKEIINPDDLQKLTIWDENDIITIISCHPFPYNYQRYVVYFERIE